jgi:hypothetical protein
LAQRLLVGVFVPELGPKTIKHLEEGLWDGQLDGRDAHLARQRVHFT